MNSNLKLAADNSIDSILEEGENQAKLIGAILNCHSSLRNRILGSAAYRLGGFAVSLVEKINAAVAAEQKYGRRPIDRSTGEPLVDSLRIRLEEVLAGYGAVMDAGGDELASFAGLDAIVANRETPYVRTLSDDQLRIRCELSGKPADQFRQEAYKAAEAKAAVFSQKAQGILGELESAMAFAPVWEVADVTVSQWNAAEAVERGIAKYKASVATGKVWDDADMVLAQADIKKLEQLI